MLVCSTVIFVLVCLLMLALSLGSIAPNSFIYATNIHKFLVCSWLGIVFLLQIIKRTFDILKTFGTYMCVNFGGFTAVVT